MPIVLDGKAIFIHIPKNAGTSIERAFGLQKPLNYPESKRRELLYGRFDEHKAVQHYTPQELIDHKLLTFESYNQMFSFTFVRNPFDRFVSEYKYRCSKHSDFPLFKEFVFHVYKLYQEDGLYGFLWNHLVPQVDYVAEIQGKGVDFIGRFENLNQDFKELCRTFDLGGLDLERHNISSSNKRYQEYFNQETRQIIEQVYGNDLEVFGYSF